MKKLIARLLLLAFVVIMVLMFTACRSRKVRTERSEKQLNELHHKDVKQSENNSIATQNFIVSENSKVSFSSVDPKLPSSLIKGKDTLKFFNVKGEISNTKINDSTKRKENVLKVNEDHSIASLESKESGKNKNIESSGPSWGVNIAIIVGTVVLLILLFVVYKTRNIKTE